ncbi:MAG: DUF3127 domain-containing protein [Bacteroidaceae bacterium]|nr:DUF3127 domain-containing protein [Bacteroidaceae bacterium]
MELTGKIIAVGAERGGVSKTTGNEWKVQEFVLETINEQYPHKLCFEVFGSDRLAQFAIKAGEVMTVSFDIDAREYNGRWFNQIRAWKVDRNVATQPAVAAPAPAAAPAQPAAQPAAPEAAPAPNPIDDLPF